MCIRLGAPTCTKLNVPFKIRMQLEQPIDGPESLRNPLRVVHAIDADEELSRRGDGAACAGGAPRSSRSAGRDAATTSGSMLIGCGWTSVVLPLRVTENCSMIDARLDAAVDGFEEVVAVVLHVERQQIVAEQAVENLVLPRADAERFAVGPGNVPELDDHEIGPRRRAACAGSSAK